MAMTIPQNKPEKQWATPSNSLIRYSKDDDFHLFYTVFIFLVEWTGKMEWSGEEGAHRGSTKSPEDLGLISPFSSWVTLGES